MYMLRSTQGVSSEKVKLYTEDNQIDVHKSNEYMMMIMKDFLYLTIERDE